jgi:hypothetical protein
MSDTEEKALIERDADLTDLIKRLEALEAPCRKVDMLIETLQTGNRQHPYLVGINIDDKPDAGRRTYPTPRYTASIDAAMTLVPEGSDWLRKGFSEMSVVLDDPNDKMWARHIDGHHKHPAIALCIAALRAQDALGFEIKEKEQ